jgi:hypothetical protein
MKKSLIRFAAIAVLVFASTFVFADSPKIESHKFKITPLENLYLGNSIEKVWTISYSDNEKPVTVTLVPSQKGREYVVRSEFFEVTYAADKDGFGVRKINASLKEIPTVITSSVLNKKQMKRQKVLTPNDVSDDYALELVASYLPDIINDNYKHLIY